MNTRLYDIVSITVGIVCAVLLVVMLINLPGIP